MVNGYSAEYHNVPDESTKIGIGTGLHHDAGTQRHVDLCIICPELVFLVYILLGHITALGKCGLLLQTE